MLWCRLSGWWKYPINGHFRKWSFHCYCNHAVSCKHLTIFSCLQEYAKTACSKTHPCGHPCGGVKNEDHCLPCLHGCDKNATNLKQDADDMCMICFTEALSAAPAIQVGLVLLLCPYYCKTMFKHRICLVGKIHLWICGRSLSYTLGVLVWILILHVVDFTAVFFRCGWAPLNGANPCLVGRGICQ